MSTGVKTPGGGVEIRDLAAQGRAKMDPKGAACPGALGVKGGWGNLLRKPGCCSEC